ncbi:diguanylate cyclase [Rhodoferax sp. TH121]|uniref:bifunctional diguanylate cyclase/phosphodiesterase n=1 Tax=Rhodoferax sp. TH121 TaxID=2022803 RepID=UPI000B961B41|nr:EAL domain-containing protein [Rhodoferax sp. TH121]OYQ39763.1 diguanylate cyclase [Rhodoferax sp. TH121]
MRLVSSRATRAVVGSVLLFVLAIVLVAVLVVRDSHRTAVTNSEGQALRFVAGAEAAVNRNLLGVDVLLASLDNLLGLANLQPEWIDSTLASRLIQGALRQNLLVRHVALLDDAGRMLASSDARGAELELAAPQDFLTQAQAQVVAGLSISKPVVNFGSSEQVLYFARPIRLADGSKVLAIAEVQVSLLSTILVQGVDIEGLEATLERGNGQLLASAPAMDSLSGTLLRPALGERNPQGATQMAARLSGVDALVVQRKMLYHDILITASIPMETVLGEWRRESWRVVGVSAVFVIMLLSAGAVALRYLQQMAQAQRSISQAKSTLDQALESMESGFLLLDAQHCVLNWNRRYLEIYPWQRAYIAVGIPFETMLAATARITLPQADAQAQRQWVQDRMALLHKRVHSHERHLPNGHVIEITERTTPDGGVVIVYQDVTHIRRASAEIEQLAFFDPLTGLPNRRLLSDRLQQAVVASARSGRKGALLFMDLDHFKTLNDTLGHDVGDLLLQQVAKRVSACVREADTVARLGGDEFVVMLQDLSPHAMEAASQAKIVGDSILATLNEPFSLNGVVYRSTSSVGATLFGESLQSSSELLKQADIAMYQVKSAGRNALCFFDPQMLAAIETRAELERDLRQSLAQGEFALYYQLQVSDENRPMGVEALVRWCHPSRGIVSPLVFIGLAEETGLIVPLGEWVMRTACEQLARWAREPGRAELQMAVNVSALQFRQDSFVELVRTILQDTGANPELLKLELTESLVLDDVQGTIAKMRELKTLGLRFSMDDFGTGQSSLTYLTKLPLDQLKIDQSFIRNLGEQAADAVMVQTILGMAETLDLEVIAEGVETEEQYEFLMAHGCHLFQGYLFATPLPVRELEILLNRKEIVA